MWSQSPHINPKVTRLKNSWESHLSIHWYNLKCTGLGDRERNTDGFSFHLSLVHGHGRKIDVKISRMAEFSLTPLGYLEHKLGDALEAEDAETIFKRIFKTLSTSSAVSVSRWQCATQRWGKVRHPFFMNALTLRTYGFLSSKTQHL